MCAFGTYSAFKGPTVSTADLAVRDAYPVGVLCRAQVLSETCPSSSSGQVDQNGGVSPADLTSAVRAIGFSAECVATTTTEEPELDENGANTVWAIASALGERALLYP